MLASWAYASQTVCERLIEKGYSGEDAAEAVAWLRGMGYLDDDAYCASVIRSQRSKGYGPRRISLYLQAHGICRENAEQALEGAFGGDESRDKTVRAIDEFLRKRAGENPDRAMRDKLAAALLRRGFEYSDIRAGLERLEE